MATIQDFLVLSRTHYVQKVTEGGKLLLVIGNESGDLDSFISAILYAYLRTQTSKTICVPVMNFPRGDISIRPELAQLFRLCHIEPSALVTQDNLSGPLELLPENTKWILVDHNVPNSSFRQQYGSCVIGVIDHHEDEGFVPLLRDRARLEPRTFTNCFSCTSLVVNHYAAEWNLDRKTAFPSILSASLAQFALVSILIDTSNNLERETIRDGAPPSRSNAIDIQAVEFLEDVILNDQAESVDYNRTGLFNTMQEAKMNVQHLEPNDLLRKDYKEWSDPAWFGQKLGISSVTMPAEEIFILPGVHMRPNKLTRGDVSTFMQSRDLYIYAIMTVSTTTNGDTKREILVFISYAEQQGFLTSFASIACVQLRLLNGRAADYEQMIGTQAGRAWQIGDTSMSRKDVAPLLRRAVTDFIPLDARLQK
ncbi:MAG: Exopolyphosphatase [Vezdaea aestivalis]|nr:MAG: Exopolyphosphatase [Vezdaea aestivalis]